MAPGSIAPAPPAEDAETPETATTAAPPAPSAGTDVPGAAAGPAASARPVDFRGSTPRAAGSNVRGAPNRLARSLETFGLKPGASLDEINTTYFTILKRFPENPTRDDEAYMRELRRAYDVLRRTYVPPRAKSPGIAIGRRLAIPALGMAAAVLGGVLLYLNRDTIRLQTTHYEPGVVLRLRSASVPFGTVVGYDAAHRFPAGAPGAAYEIRLDGRTETVWVSERLIVNGMVPVGR